MVSKSLRSDAAAPLDCPLLGGGLESEVTAQGRLRR
jgi:hypothetical protein